MLDTLRRIINEVNDARDLDQALEVIVKRVREAVRLEMAARVPAGAPGRTVPPPRTPLEKIREGLSRA